MIAPEYISPVGIGTYRMQAGNETHQQALLSALRAGYNLVDTATNYQQGTAELLIGQVLKAHPELTEKVFIISKAGYIPSESWMDAEMKDWLSRNSITKARLGDDFYYSIDPEFIRFQLERSLKKLGVLTLDCYLLHNPERYLQSTNLNSKEELYTGIKEAFRLLEKKVSEGKIRYYGISSNTLFYPEKNGSIDLRKILEIAASVSDKHHFRVIQFPYNFLEKEASEPTYDGLSLLDIARANKCITIGNRPLNMDENGMEFRLSDCKTAPEIPDDAGYQTTAEQLYSLLDIRILALTEGESKADDFEPIAALKALGTTFQNPQAVHLFFDQQLNPFLDVIATEDDAMWLLAETLRQHLIRYSERKHYEKSSSFLQQLEMNGIIQQENNALTACTHYLSGNGPDHILLGMRKPDYVFSLKGRFTALNNNSESIRELC